MKIIRNGVADMYLAWFASALFYYYQYILRVAPNVMSQNIKIEFGITADQFASLGSLYLLTYSLLQIPLGILTDKIGVRLMVIVSTIFCILGGILFARTEVFALMQFSRVLIGAGSAAALMCALKLIADGFPLGRRGILMGLTLTMGTAGALCAGEIIQKVSLKWGWREASLFSVALGAITLIIAITLIPKLSIKHDLRKVVKHYEGSIYEELLALLKHRYILTYAIIAIGLYSPIATFGDLWGSSFLSQKFSLNQSEASSISLLLYLGLGIGSILIPWLAERFKIIDFALIACTLCVLALLLFIVYGPIISKSSLKVLMILTGICGGAEMLCFTAAIQYSKVTNSGEIIGIVNTLNMLGSAALQQVVGSILDYRWSGTFADHTRYYSTHDYTTAMMPIAVIIICCVLVSFSLISKKNA